MKTILFEISGNWGHFKRPETNNNPLSHDLITKTALIGMIGAVLGKEREEMKSLFPQLSEDLLYSVQLLNAVKKISWGFTSRTAFKPWQSGTPKYFEFLKNPKFKIILSLKDNRSEVIFLEFVKYIKNEYAIFTPILGWHNCPANINFISYGEVSEMKKGIFETSGFIEKPPKHKPKLLNINFRVGFEKLPTYQDNDFWNLPSFYKEVIYPDANSSISVEGDYYEYLNDNSKWWLI
jgi:CRISPR-associated protein Cas5 subtype I-B